MQQPLQPPCRLLGIDLREAVVGIGNCSGETVDKFSRFGLSTEAAARVSAPLIAEAHACFERRLYDNTLVEKLNFFAF